MTALDWWKGEGGDAYTARNRVDWMKRIPFWDVIMEDLKPRAVLEIGSNAGWNLLAIRQAAPHVRLEAVEPNARARAEAIEAHGFEVVASLDDLSNHFVAGEPILEFDLVFTAGVLIHVPPEELRTMMENIVAASKRYVIAIEYDAPEETEIEYRGESGLLWKRPYGKLYEAMGLKIIGAAHLPPESGFDNCGYWLLEKQGE